MKVRITGTPPGFAPEAIREKWVGIEMQSIGREKPGEVGLPRTGTDNQGGYKFTAEEALKKLKEHDQEAHDFWVKHLPPGSHLVFKEDVCEEI